MVDLRSIDAVQTAVGWKRAAAAAAAGERRRGHLAGAVVRELFYGKLVFYRDMFCSVRVILLRIALCSEACRQPR